MNWDSFKWRNHQPEIGRFFNVDPLATKYVYNSPYAFSENHVTAHVELEGLEKAEINHDGFEGMLDRSAKTEVKVERKGATINVSGHDANGTVVASAKMKVQGDVNPSTISDHTAQVVGENMMQSGNTSATITSSIRNDSEQAEVMYNNAEKYGTDHEYNLYGSGGDKVVDTYSTVKSLLGGMQALGLPVSNSSSIIKGAMQGTINMVGLPNVSNHGGDQQALNVIDISKGSISNPIQFNNALQNDPNVRRALTPYTKKSDPAFHIEVPQNH